MTFESPWAFLFLLVLPALVWWRWKKNAERPAIRFSWTGNAVMAGRSLRQKLAVVPLAVRILAMVLLIVAIARPREGLEQVREVNQGIAIEMVLDRSSSMSALMMFEGQPMNRLEVVKKVFESFVLGGEGKLEGRANDLIGMISFAHYPETICPLTLAHQALPRFLETVQLAQPRTDEDGTAIGDAIALAAARLKTAEEALARQVPGREDEYEIKSKIMILLTDGKQTAGERVPLEAAKLAEEWGIKIYTIAVTGPPPPRSPNSFFGGFFNLQRQEADTDTLRTIANATEGRFFEATDATSLTTIYQEIDQLERSEIEAVRFTDYRELFLPFALAGLLLLSSEVILTSTVFRRVP